MRRTCQESGKLLDALEVCSCFLVKPRFNQAPVEVSDAIITTYWDFQSFPLSSFQKVWRKQQGAFSMRECPTAQSSTNESQRWREEALSEMYFCSNLIG